MHILSSVRWWLARARWPMWCAVAGLALTVAWIVGRHVTALNHTRLAWGQTRTVWVVTHDAQPGDVVRAQERGYPQAVVPPSALSSWVPGAVARHVLALGAVLTDSDVSPDGAAARIPRGWVAVLLPIEPGMFRVGDAAVAFAADRRLTHGVVVEIADHQLALAVPDGEAGAVAAAVAEGRISLALSATPPGSPATP